MLRGAAEWVDARDVHLILPKLIFFLLNFLLYTTYTNQADYLQDVWNLDISTFGYIASIPSISFFCSVAWTSLAKFSGRFKAIIGAATAAYSAVFLLMHMLAPFFSTAPFRFYIVFGLFACMSILSSALFPLIDHKLYVKLSKDARFSPQSFGRQRLWGSVGQGLAGFLAGAGIKAFGYDALFGMSFVACVLLIFCVLIGIPSRDGEKEGAEEKSYAASAASAARKKQPEARLQGIKWLSLVARLMSVEFVLFLVVVLIAGYSRAIVGNHLVRYLQVNMSLSKMSSGGLILIRTVPEIACYFFSKNALDVFDVNLMLFVAQAAGLLRVALYALLDAEFNWTPYFIESLRGVNNAFLMAAGVRLAHDLAPVDARSIALGFFHGVLGNLTTGIAGIAGSLISEQCQRLDPTVTEGDIIYTIFRYSALASASGVVVFAVFWAIASYNVRKAKAALNKL